MTIIYGRQRLSFKDSASMKTKRIRVGALDCKEVTDTGEFEGHGSVFGTVDSYQEIVAAGAFKKSLKEHKSAGTLPAMLWQHIPSEPMGTYSEMKEDDKGLFVKGRLELETQRGREAHALLKGGALRGLSIGYMPMKWKFDEESKLTTLTEIDLWEVSVVTFAANPDAFIEGVKSWRQMTKRDLEAALRDVCDFSQTDVKRMISALHNEPANRDGCVDSETLASMRQFTETLSKG